MLSHSMKVISSSLPDIANLTGEKTNWIWPHRSMYNITKLNLIVIPLSLNLSFMNYLNCPPIDWHFKICNIGSLFQLAQAYRKSAQYANTPAWSDSLLILNNFSSLKAGSIWALYLETSGWKYNPFSHSMLMKCLLRSFMIPINPFWMHAYLREMALNTMNYSCLTLSCF